MNLEPVSSGHIAAMGWEDETMMIRFSNGNEYIYSNVSFSQYEAIKEAPSVGRALYQSGLKGSLV